MKANNTISSTACAVMFQQALRGALHRAQGSEYCTVVYNENTDQFACVLPGGYQDPEAVAIKTVTQGWGKLYGFYTLEDKINDQAIEEHFNQDIVDHLVANAQRTEKPNIRHMITLFRGSYRCNIYVDINDRVAGYGDIGVRRLRELLYLPTLRELERDVVRNGLTIDQLNMIIYPIYEDVQDAIGVK